MSSMLVSQQSAKGFAARQSSLPGLCPVAQAVEALATDAGTEARGAVFTRREIVEFLLDLCGYRLIVRYTNSSSLNRRLAAGTSFCLLSSDFSQHGIPRMIHVYPLKL